MVELELEIRNIDLLIFSKQQDIDNIEEIFDKYVNEIEWSSAKEKEASKSESEENSLVAQWKNYSLAQLVVKKKELRADLKGLNNTRKIKFEALINLIKEKETVIKQKDNHIYNTSLKRLLKEGIPKLIIQKNSVHKTYSSTHEKVQLSIQDTVMKNLIKESKTVVKNLSFGRNGLPSTFLTSYGIDNIRLKFSAESTIHSAVQMLMTDILRLTDKHTSLCLVLEKNISSADQSDGSRQVHRPGIWIIKTVDGRPVAVIEVKSPLPLSKQNKDEVSVKDREEVTGQIYTYMCKQASFHGQIDVIGIITDFSYWRICWFPHSDEFMSSSIATKPSKKTQTFLSKFGESNKMLLHGSALIKASKNPDLISILVMVINKCFDAKIYSVPLLSDKRQYIQFQTSCWNWKYISKEDLEGLKISLHFQETEEQKKSSTITVLRYYQGGLQSNVFLGMNSKGTPQAVV